MPDVHGEFGGQQRVGGHLPGTTGHHQSEPERLRGGQEQQELKRRLVRPVHVLDDQKVDSEAVQEFGEGSDQLVPGGTGIGRRLRRGWQAVCPF
ncbi:hypothetical protein [Streptomyces sp. NPDC056242]|uniref:hypothetical protein n=1 Tax=Streptomyces sp. NPDC056242 TaxID=3345760 RepID=UPI0035DA440C